MQWSAPAPQLALPRVEATATRAGDRVTVIARTRRHAGRLALAVRGGTVLSVNGVAPSRMPSRVFRSSNDWRFAVGEGMEEMRVEISARGPADIIVSDVSYGFPAEGATLLRARDTSNAVPQQEGDVTITRVRMRK
jgi:hypothetical protein